MYELMKSVDEVIKNELLPLIIRASIADKEKELYSLPTRLGGLGIPLFGEKVKNDLKNSLLVLLASSFNCKARRIATRSLQW